MLTVSSTDSLYGKIVLRYFGFGLTCIALLMAVTVLDRFLPAGRPDWMMIAAAVLPLAVLWLGGIQLRKILTTPEQILSQLVHLSDDRPVYPNTLVPVTHAEPAADGWNHLLQQMLTSPCSDRLEKKLAQALRAGGDARMHDVLNTLSDGVAVCTSEGSINAANHAFCALLDVHSESAVSEVNILDLLAAIPVSGDCADRVPREVKRCRVELEKADESNNGVFRITCVPLVTDAEESDLFVWSVRDVTQQKLAEQMRTEFVETATHELRTPLTNIRAYAETLQLQNDIPIEQQKDFINIINAEATRLGRFVDELLNLSRMDAGSITVSKHETDFERMLQECIEHCRPQMEAKHQAFETQIPPKISNLFLDKDKIASCLVNLIGNAVKYTEDGGVVRLVVEESPTELSIRVEDTGIGISEEELPRVFNRFFRSTDDRVLQESGSGLGLAFTEEIVRLHGGRLTVQSKLNEGSQFTLFLPL